MAAPLTIMQKTTGSSEVPAPRAIGTGDDEVVVGGGGGLEPISSKCKVFSNVAVSVGATEL